MLYDAKLQSSFVRQVTMNIQVSTYELRHVDKLDGENYST